ncbi:WGR domain-containing protein [Shinella sp.]|uniref:WGR domain-containing protein n=2 Tax=Shinella sp. TaxID=1870904 RepID=UPI00289FADB3|nr:WGR domain-containing protein [Shinella sp.]
MNRSARIDSTKLLDTIPRHLQIRRMEQGTSRHFIRCDPSRNMNRFYRLTVTRDLLGQTLLIREWGRVGVYAAAVQTRRQGWRKPCATRQRSPRGR